MQQFMSLLDQGWMFQLHKLGLRGVVVTATLTFEPSVQQWKIECSELYGDILDTTYTSYFEDIQKHADNLMTKCLKELGVYHAR